MAPAILFGSIHCRAVPPRLTSSPHMLDPSAPRLRDLADRLDAAGDAALAAAARRAADEVDRTEPAEAAPPTPDGDARPDR